MTRSWIIPVLFARMAFAAPAETVARLSIYPSEAELSGEHARQSILVMALLDSGIQRDVTAEGTYQNDPPGVLRVTPEGAVALREGGSRITVSYRGRSAEARFTVTNLDSRRPVSFISDIAPILTQFGCTGSNCHGSVRGKAGFKLSLFGSRPDLDYEAVVKADHGRRVNLERPDESLVLAKPTMKIPHGGGLRFHPDSEQFDLIRRWIASGTIYDNGGPKLDSIRVYPDQQILVGSNAKQRLIVTGRYSDGTAADFTNHARYTSNDDSTASVDDRGVVTGKRAGETAIMIRAQGRTAVASIAISLSPPRPDYPAVAANNFIDEVVFAKLKKLNIVPSTLSNDSVFLRRVYLDTVGVLPSPAETRRFLADRSPEKRARLIDQLLDRPEFADLWAMKFADLFQLGGTGVKGGWLLHRWIRQSLEDRKPYDQMVREMIVGTGSYVYDPTANFYFGLFTGPEGMVTQVSQSLLGVRMDCAKCHDHPFENWTQDDFYGMGAFFTRLVRKAEPYGLFEHAVVLRPTGKPSYDYLGNNKEFLHPRTKQPVKPRFLGGDTVEFRADEDIRQKLADWLTSPRNPWFTKAFVNRIWKHHLGRGIVEPVDDFRVSNPPSNPVLLDRLAEYQIKVKYDLRALCRLILNSRTYQLSSAANPSNESDTLNYSRFYVKRQTAEELFDTMGQASEARQKVPGAPPEDRAISVAVGSPNYFLTTFGKMGAREQICERDQEPNVAQAMHLINGDTVQAMVTKRDNIIGRLLSQRDWPEVRRIEEMYFAALSRAPTEKEASHFLSLLKDANGEEARKLVYQDLLWAILNSKEFAYVY